MIIGSFDKDGRPYVQGRLFLPRLNIDGYIDFLVDTGSDATCLHAKDGLRLDVPYDKLRGVQNVEGVGGEAQYYLEGAVLFLADGKLLRTYVTPIAISAVNDHFKKLPSLLGQDVLQNFWMRHDPGNARLEFTVRGAALTFKGTLDGLPGNITAR